MAGPRSEQIGERGVKPFALISVSDKTGIAEFARSLNAKGYEILSTGGTAKQLAEAGVDFTGVSYYTGMPEVFGGRVKTLHPKIHGGLLAKPEDKKHIEEMEELNIRPIGILAANLYPFEQTVLSGSRRDEILEQIDIGGVAMIRAAAKNADNVLVIVDPGDYTEVVESLDDGPDESLRRKLQAKAFAYTAFYDSLVAEYLRDGLPSAPGETITLGYRLMLPLRYGENPHQQGGLYLRPFEKKGVGAAEQLWGKELSYNNLLDAEAAWELSCDLDRLHAGTRRPCTIVKHSNPCGAGWSKSALDSFREAKQGDPVSSFGGIVGVPGELDQLTAEAIAEKGNFFEVIVCGSFTKGALEVFKERSGWGKNVRLLAAGDPPEGSFLSARSLRGGAVIQSADTGGEEEWKCVTEQEPSEEELSSLRNAWVVVKHVKSNAIAVASESRVLGIGAGQMNRVQSVRLALQQAGDNAKGAVLASDAFFPFDDSIEAAAEAGITAIVQPGGSKRDAEVIDASNRLGIRMVFTGVRHFRH